MGKQHRVQPALSWRNHIQGWMNVQESYSRALEQGTLTTTTLAQQSKQAAAISTTWVWMGRRHVVARRREKSPIVHSAGFLDIFSSKIEDDRQRRRYPRN